MDSILVATLSILGRATIKQDITAKKSFWIFVVSMTTVTVPFPNCSAAPSTMHLPIYQMDRWICCTLMASTPMRLCDMISRVGDQGCLKAQLFCFTTQMCENVTLAFGACGRSCEWNFLVSSSCMVTASVS